MEFWFVTALLTVAAVLAVLLPLTRRGRGVAPGESNDLEVYRDQLREIDADAARGAIDAESAEQARIEISRRILAAKKTADAARSTPQGAGRVAALLAVLVVPLVAWGVYPLVGAPDMPSMPLSARMTADPSRGSVDELVARAEAHLAQNPDDAKGWDVLAPIYLRLGRAADSANAWRTAIRLKGENFPRLLGLGEALTAVAGGAVTAEADALFAKAAALEPGDVRPQYYLAEGEVQDGKPAVAADRLQAFLDKAPADAPWRAQAQRAIARLRGAPAPAAPGPTTADVEAASSLSSDDRQTMIEGMVGKLDARLRESGGGVEDWKRLVRSYMILQRRDAAADALARGLKALQGDDAAALKNFAAGLGLQAGDDKP